MMDAETASDRKRVGEFVTEHRPAGGVVQFGFRRQIAELGVTSPVGGQAEGRVEAESGDKLVIDRHGRVNLGKKCPLLSVS